MKHFLLSLATGALILVPSVASATYSTPSELISAIRAQGPRDFTTTLHGALGSKTYVSLWSKGRAESLTSGTEKRWMIGTLDIVSGKTNIRIKGESFTVAGNQYFKVKSMNGKLDSDGGTIFLGASQKQWLRFDATEPALEASLAQGIALDLGSIKPDEANKMFSLHTTEAKGTTVYILKILPSYAPVLGNLIRTMLHDHGAATDDFFPWVSLGEKVRYEIIVRTDAKNKFASSSTSLSLRGLGASVSMTSAETALTTPFTISAPTESISGEEALGMLFGMVENNLAEKNTEEDVIDTEDKDVNLMLEETSFDTVEEVDDVIDSAICADPDANPIYVLSLKRVGACPVTKPSTRTSWYR